MIVMCFDLSSTCIGVTFGKVVNNHIKALTTLAVYPSPPSGHDLGYTTKNPKTIYYKGKTFQGFLKPEEAYISKKEAERRMSKYRSSAHKGLLKDIGKKLGFYLELINPDILAIERNEAFNGVMTTKLLAEIAGGIYFYAGMKKKPLFDINVSKIRAKIRKDIKEFTRYETVSELDEARMKLMALDTKWEIYCRLRSYFETNHPGLVNFKEMTMDESDSLAVFYYIFTSELLKEKEDSDNENSEK